MHRNATVAEFGEALNAWNEAIIDAIAKKFSGQPWREDYEAAKRKLDALVDVVEALSTISVDHVAAIDVQATALATAAAKAALLHHDNLPGARAALGQLTVEKTRLNDLIKDA